MTKEHVKAVNDLIKDLILDLLDDAPEEKLIETYVLLKGTQPHTMPQSRVTTIPPPPEMDLGFDRPITSWPERLDRSRNGRPSESGEFPAATVAVTRRALERLGKPAKLAEIYAEVCREQPAITKASVSGALARLSSPGVREVTKTGETKASVYSLTPPKTQALR